MAWNPGRKAALWGSTFALGVIVVGFASSTARADDPPPPPPPTPVTGAPAGGDGATAPKDDAAAKKVDGAPKDAGAATAAPTATPTTVPGLTRPRPPPPPPPDTEVPTWDMFYKARGVPLPPPPPPPDPFDPRAIVFRHDREVSADGRIKEVRRVPQWVDVIQRSEIEEWRPLTLGDFLLRLPNVNVADGGSPFLALPRIRGLGGDRVKIMTDGVWPETQILGVSGATMSLWDPESTDRVEVYHGPGAYLRGLDAGGGVINVVPLRPHRHECPEAWVTGASSYRSADNTFRERIAVDAGAGRVAGLLGVTYDDTGDRDTPDGTLDPSSYHWWAADLALDYFLDNQSTIGFTGQYVRASDIKSPVGSGDDFTQPSYERLFLALTLSSMQMGPIFHGTRMSINFDSFIGEDDQNSSLSLTNGVSSKDDVDSLSFRLQGNLYILPCHDTWAELSVAWAHLKRTERILCTPLVAPDTGVLRWMDDIKISPTAVPGTCIDGVASYEASELALKLLVEDEWHNACWDFHLGGRLDYYWIDDDRTGDTQDHFLWGVAGGVSRHVTDCWTLYGNASYGQRQPTIQEMFSIAVLNGTTVFGNPDLKYEENVNGEIGMKWSRFNSTTLQLAAFGHWIGDYVGLTPVLNDAFWNNVGDVFLYGAEATGSWRPNPCRCEGLEFFGSAGVTWSDDTSIVRDVPLAGRAGARFSKGCGPVCGVRRWFVEAAARGALEDGFLANGDAFVTAEVLAGMGLSRGTRRAAWANIGVTNLFDVEYTEPFARLPAAGVSLIASISFEF